MMSKLIRSDARPMLLGTLIACSTLLAGCAARGLHSDSGDVEPPAELATLAAAVASNPRDAGAHLELARAWERLAVATPGEAQYREFAQAGYQSALRFAPQDPVANLLAGRAEFMSGRYEAAQSAFANAVLAAPDDPTALLAFATASYHAGDAPVAALAAQRAAVLAPNRAEPVRLLALAAAASGDADRSGTALQRYAQLEQAPQVDALRARTAALLRTVATDEPVTAGEGGGTAAAARMDQVSVDVAIILSQNTRRSRIGFNLLDGLRAQYSYGDQTSESRSSGVGSTQRTITSAISTPALNYNLNIFNNSGQFYQVVARPTLTAYRGEPSEFFIGRTSNIPVAGVNVATLERVDIGISLKVTPLEIDGDRVKVRVETGRSFASNEAAGSFAEALTLFRQNVAATAEVGFGETLVLSGLSESVNDSANTKTPGLGDLPIAGMAFNERSKLERRDAALVLLTPSRVMRVASSPWLRPEAVQKLVKLWSQVIDPSSNGVDVVTRLERTRLFKRANASDAPLLWTDGGGLRAFESLLLSRP
jgi:pilus assembly protein CpaC